MSTEAVLRQTLAEKEENELVFGKVQQILQVMGAIILVIRPLITTERSYLTSCRQGT